MLPTVMCIWQKKKSGCNGSIPASYPEFLVRGCWWGHQQRQKKELVNAVRHNSHYLFQDAVLLFQWPWRPKSFSSCRPGNSCILFIICGISIRPIQAKRYYANFRCNLSPNIISYRTLFLHEVIFRSSRHLRWRKFPISPQKIKFPIPTLTINSLSHFKFPICTPLICPMGNFIF